ncbi:hypothetical protein ACFLTX_01730 [Chloroflexota bacterium]
MLIIGQVIAGRYAARDFIGCGGITEVYSVLRIERIFHKAMILLHALNLNNVVYIMGIF